MWRWSDSDAWDWRAVDPKIRKAKTVAAAMNIMFIFLFCVMWRKMFWYLFLSVNLKSSSAVFWYNEAFRTEISRLRYILYSSKCIQQTFCIWYRLVLNSTFSSGLCFDYWSSNSDYLRSARAIDQSHKHYNNERFYSGYDRKQLYINIDQARYKSIKQELLQSGNLTFTVYNIKILTKAQCYMKSKPIKSLKSIQAVKFGISNDAKATLEQVLSLICYCDLTEYSREWSASLDLKTVMKH